jgi:hypothetical protein
VIFYLAGEVSQQSGGNSATSPASNSGMVLLYWLSSVLLTCCEKLTCDLQLLLHLRVCISYNSCVYCVHTDVRIKLISRSNRQTVWSTERGVVELLQVSNDVTSTIYSIFGL